MTSSSYQIIWHGHNVNLFQTVDSFRESNQFTDLVLCTMDGAQILVHKLILCACSVYINSLFTTELPLSQQGGAFYVVLPPEISCTALSVLIDFIYKGKIIVADDMVKAVLQAGELLKVRGFWNPGGEAEIVVIPAPDDGIQNPVLQEPPIQHAVVALAGMPVAPDQPAASNLPVILNQPAFNQPATFNQPAVFSESSVFKQPGALGRSATPGRSATSIQPAMPGRHAIPGWSATLSRPATRSQSATPARLTTPVWPANTGHSATASQSATSKQSSAPGCSADSGKAASAGHHQSGVSAAVQPAGLSKPAVINWPPSGILWSNIDAASNDPTVLGVPIRSAVPAAPAQPGAPCLPALPLVRSVPGSSGSKPYEPRISVKKNDKLLKGHNPIQGGVKPIIIDTKNKLFFIKQSEGGIKGLGSGTSKILVSTAQPPISLATVTTPTPITTVAVPTTPDNKKTGQDHRRIFMRQVGDTVIYAKKTKADQEDTKLIVQTNSTPADWPVQVEIKEESDWDAHSIEETALSFATIFNTELTVKEEPPEEYFLPNMLNRLTCKLCPEVFIAPAAWVRHVQGHMSEINQTRKRKHRSANDDTEELLLCCDLCKKYYLEPGEWVRHIINNHTELELAMSNKRAQERRHNRSTGVQNKTCLQCNKTFASHASLLNHERTHTGERPFVCGRCNRGFSVKSNLLRHLRTLHDQYVSPEQVEEAAQEEQEDPDPMAGPLVTIKQECPDMDTIIKEEENATFKCP